MEVRGEGDKCWLSYERRSDQTIPESIDPLHACDAVTVTFFVLLLRTHRYLQCWLPGEPGLPGVPTGRLFHHLYNPKGCTGSHRGTFLFRHRSCIHPEWGQEQPDWGRAQDQPAAGWAEMWGYRQRGQCVVPRENRDPQQAVRPGWG
jgi:hypothetical protein